MKRILTNGQNVVSGLPGEGSRFYRLRKTP